MRDRRPSDWRTDLSQRRGLEATVEAAIERHPTLTRLATSTASFDRLDFQVAAPGDRSCEIELKAKRQSYRDWPTIRPGFPESDLFILDELALRRIVEAGRYAFLLVRDVPRDRWCLWSTTELVLTTKVRVERHLAVGAGSNKGKLLVDLGSAAAQVGSVELALDAVCTHLEVIDRRWADIRPWPWSERRARDSGAKGA